MQAGIIPAMAKQEAGLGRLDASQSEWRQTSS